MRREIPHKIERYLDEKLGIWSRLLPWRREMALHLEETYQAVRADTPGPETEDVSWQETLARFGDVQDVAAQLRREHWPQYIGWRLLVVAVAVSAVVSLSGLACFIDGLALGFVLTPLLAFVAIDACRGSIRWDLACRVGSWGAFSGGVLGTLFMVTNLADPARVGHGMALCVLSALYCVLFLTPRRPMVVALLTLVVLDVGLVWTCIGGSSAGISAWLPGDWDRVDGSFVMYVLAICAAGTCTGIARFGIHGIAQQAPIVGAATFLISVIALLSQLSDPSLLIPHVWVSAGAMALAIYVSQGAGAASRTLRRALP